jgi:hypothetical protein
VLRNATGVEDVIGFYRVCLGLRLRVHLESRCDSSAVFAHPMMARAAWITVVGEPDEYGQLDGGEGHFPVEVEAVVALAASVDSGRLVEVSFEGLTKEATSEARARLAGTVPTFVKGRRLLLAG